MAKKSHLCPACGTEMKLVKHESRGAYKANRDKYKCPSCEEEDTLYADGMHDEKPDDSIANFPGDSDEQLCIHGIPENECVLCGDDF